VEGLTIFNLLKLLSLFMSLYGISAARERAHLSGRLMFQNLISKKAQPIGFSKNLTKRKNTFDA
jgi:hypothetical protein